MTSHVMEFIHPGADDRYMTFIQNPPTTTPSSRPEDDTTRLRTILRINAASSFVSGAVMVAAPDTVDDLLDTGDPGWIRLVGIGLILFALNVAFTSTLDRRKLVAATPAIIAGDIGWVVGSIVTALLGWYSGGGIAAVLTIAAMVGTSALMQWNALRHIC